jgi:hypothetical protein
MKCNFKFVHTGDDRLYCSLKDNPFGFCDESECILQVIKSHLLEIERLNHKGQG